MARLSKVTRLALMLVLGATCISTGMAYARPLTAATASASLRNYGVGSKVKLIKADHTHVTGEIAALADDSVTIQLKGAGSAETVPFAEITTVRDRSSIASRLRAGPCGSPIVMILTAPILVPIVTIEYISGH